MSDRLKEFISKHEAEFDQEPRDGHLERFKQLNIQKNVVPRKGQDFTVWKMVAMLVVILGVGYLFFNLGKMQATNNLVADNYLEESRMEMTEAEIFFSEKVATKKQEVLAFSEVNDPATQQIMLELDKLELQYMDLKEELTINSDNPQIINAMVENYRSRFSLLEKLLEQLKKANTIKQKHHVEVQA